MLKILFSLLLMLFPWAIRRRLLNLVFNYRIADGASIGVSLILPKYLTMDCGSRIGHLTVVKGLDSVIMKSCARLGNLNWVSGFPSGNKKHFLGFPNRRPQLIICEHAAITNRHLIDCTDSVEIGRYTTFAGFRSQILTHSIDLITSNQGCKPVVIGEYCFVGTGSIILGGATLPGFSVLGAGSLLNSIHVDRYSLYGGIPAKKIQELPESYAYFNRKRGFVD